MNKQLEQAMKGAVILSIIKIQRRLIESASEELGDQHPIVKSLQEALKVALQYKPAPYSVTQ